MLSKKEKPSSYGWLNKFSKELSVVNIKEAYDEFQAFDTSVGEFMRNIEEAQFIAIHRLPPEARDNKITALNLMTALSYNLLRSIKKCSMALNHYITLTNNLYKPMQEVFSEFKLMYDSKSAKELFVDDVDEMLKKIKPILIDMNKDLKEIIKENELKDSELRIKNDTVKRKNQMIDKFITKDAKRSDCIKVYLKLMKASNKKPNSVTLALASSENRISKSTWARILNETAFLNQLNLELEKLIKRTKNKDKREFYTSVFYDIDIEYAQKIKTDFEIKGISLRADKISTDSQED